MSGMGAKKSDFEVTGIENFFKTAESNTTSSREPAEAVEKPPSVPRLSRDKTSRARARPLLHLLLNNLHVYTKSQSRQQCRLLSQMCKVMVKKKSLLPS